MNERLSDAIKELKAIEEYARQNEDFSQGGTATNEDIFGRDPNCPGWSVGLTTYTNSIESALSLLDDDESDEALRAAGIDYDL